MGPLTWPRGALLLGMLCSCRNRNATRAQANDVPLPSREHATGARARVCGLTGGEHDDAPFLANLPQSARSLTARHFELTCEKGGWIRAAISGPGRGHPYPGPTGGTGTYRYLVPACPASFFDARPEPPPQSVKEQRGSSTACVCVCGACDPVRRAHRRRRRTAGCSGGSGFDGPRPEAQETGGGRRTGPPKVP